MTGGITEVNSMCGGRGSRVGQPFFKLSQRQFALRTMTLFAVSNLLIQGRKQIERYIRRLEILRIGMGHVMDERSKGRYTRGRIDLRA